MSEPQSYKRCISCGKAFPHTHPGVMLGVYWACCAECNSNDDNRNKKPTCCMCLREITSSMTTRCFKPNGEDRLEFCSSVCASAHTRGYSGWTVCDMVVSDVHMRRVKGQERYGQPVDWNDGRDYLQEAYEEALDMCVYLRALIAKRDENGRKQNATASGGSRSAGLFAATGN